MQNQRLLHTQTTRPLWWIAGFVALMVISFIGCDPPDDQEPVLQGGEVHGYVIADLEGQRVRTSGTIYLPDVTAYLRNLSTNAESPKVTTDLAGFFVVPKQDPGRYEVCLEAPGYVSACPDTVSISDEMLSVGQLPLVPQGRALVGTVMLERGGPCVFIDPVFGVNFHTDVRAIDAGGTEVAPAARANTAGRYVLPAVGGGVVQVQARCEGATGQQSVGPAPSGNLVNVTLPNSRPTRVVVVARDAGRAVRRAAPGTTVRVSVEATDSDALHYRWNVSGAGRAFVSQDANTVEWTLPNSRSPNTIYVAVLDGRGGVALGKFSVSTGNEGLLFTGTVTANNEPVDSAQVELNGVATQTNRLGGFAVMAPAESNRYALTIKKPGFQIFSRVFDSGVVGGTYELVPAQQFNVDPNEGGTFSEDPTGGRRGAQIVLSPGSLVGPEGNRVTGPVSGFISTIDLRTGRFPGDYGGINREGQEVSINSLGVVDIEFTDAAGNILTLASGATALLSIPVDSSQLGLPGSPKQLPETIPIWTFDTKTGLWLEEGVGTLRNGFYEVEVTHFSTFNADFEFANPACMRLLTDVGKIPTPFDLRVSIPAVSPSKVLTKTVSDQLSVIVRLPESTDILLEVLDTAGNVIPQATVTATTALTSSPTFPAYAYASCTSEAELSLEIPTSGSLLAVGSGFPSYINNASEADYYYATIDPTSTAGAGTLSSSGTTVTGAGGTLFLSAVEVGQIIDAAGQFRLVSSVTSNTELETESDFNPVLPASTTYNIVGEKHTLDLWRTANGFDDGEDQEAIYLNAGDLGLGRWMRMEQDGSNIAYFVSNHGLPPNAGSVDLAVFGNLTNDETLGLIATVAMEYSPHPTVDPLDQYTKFYVYNAAGNRVNKADLDGNGEKYIPNLCVVCHGNSPTNWKFGQPGALQADAEARFIFFDPESFEYSTIDPQFEQLAQEIPFRELNRGVLDETNVSDAIQDAIEGWYGGAALPDPAQDETFVPGGWSVESSLYSDVVKPSCRACHTTRDDYLAWDTFNLASHPNSAHTGFDESAGFIRSLVCGPTRLMPHAVVTFDSFWLSTAPHQPAAVGSVLSTTNPAGWPVSSPCPCKLAGDVSPENAGLPDC